MDIRHLANFLAVAEHGGFSAAARDVPISQPALSQSVRDLERELGTELFVRLGRRVALTPAGEALVGPARRALRDVEAGRAAVAEVAGLQVGRLALCCLPTLAGDPLAAMIARFRDAHPGVVVELEGPERPADVARLVREGSCEIGVSERQPAADDLVQHPLAAQELLVVVPPGTAVPGGPVPLTALAGTPMIATPGGASTRRLLDEAFAEAGAPASVGVVTALRDAVLPLVLGGAGAALLPQPMAELATRLGAAVVRPDPPIRRNVVLVRRAAPLTPAAGRFWSLATG